MKNQEKLNNRPRKIIGFNTPQEMMDSEIKYVDSKHQLIATVCCVRTLNAALTEKSIFSFEITLTS